MTQEKSRVLSTLYIEFDAKCALAIQLAEQAGELYSAILRIEGQEEESIEGQARRLALASRRPPLRWVRRG